MATNTELSNAIDTMLGPSLQRMAALSSALPGSGPEAAAAMKSLEKFASSMIEVGRTTAADIGALRLRTDLPREHRMAGEREAHDLARVQIAKFNEGGHASAAQ